MDSMLAAQLSPVSLVVSPPASGSVVQASVPTTCASTNMKSQPASVSNDVWNLSRAAVAAVRSTVLVSRLYDTSACPLHRYQSPSYGSYGAAPGSCQSIGAFELPNCGYLSFGRKLEVARNEAVWPAPGVAVKPVKAPSVPVSGSGVPAGPVPPSLMYEYAPSQYCWKSLPSGRQVGSFAARHS